MWNMHCALLGKYWQSALCLSKEIQSPGIAVSRIIYLDKFRNYRLFGHVAVGLCSWFPQSPDDGLPSVRCRQTAYEYFMFCMVAKTLPNTTLSNPYSAITDPDNQLTQALILVPKWIVKFIFLPSALVHRGLKLSDNKIWPSDWIISGFLTIFCCLPV